MASSVDRAADQCLDGHGFVSHGTDTFVPAVTSLQAVSLLIVTCDSEY